MSNKELGLFAVFYDGETRPVAGFVLEQDAERYAKQYSGGASYEIKHVHVVDDVRADTRIVQHQGESSKSVSTAQLAREAGKQAADWAFRLENPLTSETDLCVAETVFTSIIQSVLEGSDLYRAGLEAAATRAFAAVQAVELSEYEYSALQKAATVAANIRALAAGYQQGDK